MQAPTKPPDSSAGPSISFSSISGLLSARSSAIASILGSDELVSPSSPASSVDSFFNNFSVSASAGVGSGALGAVGLGGGGAGNDEEMHALPSTVTAPPALPPPFGSSIVVLTCSWKCLTILESQICRKSAHY